MEAVLKRVQVTGQKDTARHCRPVRQSRGAVCAYSERQIWSRGRQQRCSSSHIGWRKFLNQVQTKQTHVTHGGSGRTGIRGATWRRAHKTATCCESRDTHHSVCQHSFLQRWRLDVLKGCGRSATSHSLAAGAQDEAHAGRVLAAQRAHLLQHGQGHVVDEGGVPAHELQPLAWADDAVARGVRLRERLPPQRGAGSGRAPCA